MPVTHIQSAGGATISAQIQTKTSPQGTPTGQPTPILPNTPLSPPSGMTTVTLNTRPILPQQQQQQRKISAGRILDLPLVSFVFTPCPFANVSCYIGDHWGAKRKLLSWIPACFSYLVKRRMVLWGTGWGREGHGIKRIFSPILPTVSVRWICCLLKAEVFVFVFVC